MNDNPTNGLDGDEGHDPLTQRATAYVFGELSQEEAEAFDAELNESSDLKEVVASIRDAVEALESEFASETIVMSESSREKVAQAISSPTLEDNTTNRSTWISLALAGCVVIVGTLIAYPMLNQQNHVASSDTSNSERTPSADAIVELSGVEEDSGDTIGELEPVVVSDVEAVETRIAANQSAMATLAARDVDELDSGLLADQIQLHDSGERRFKQKDTLGEIVESEGEALADISTSWSKSSQPKTEAYAKATSDLPMFAAPASPVVAEPRKLSRPMAAASVPNQSGKQQGQAKESQRVKNQPIDAPVSSLRANLSQVNRAKPFFADSSGPVAGKKLSEVRVRRHRSDSTVPSREKVPINELSIAHKGKPNPGSPDLVRNEALGRTVLSKKLNPLMTKRREIVANFGASHPSLHRIDQELELVRSGLRDLAKLQADHFSEGIASGDQFARIHDNPFQTVTSEPLSTFSIDVDTASYSKVRMYLNQHQMLPQPDAVRIEEMINYFDYGYEPPTDEHPFSADMEIASCPWNTKHRLARVGIKGKVIKEDRPRSNLVFLLDVSGSMNNRNKLPLVIDGMKQLVDQLNENDSIAIVVYAGAAGLVLESTTGDKKKIIRDALDRLQAGGSTAGAQGIQLAYNIARDNFITGGTNRVILCTDGDFNVGVTGTDALVKLAAENAKGNIFLSVMGYGIGNHNDSMMEAVSNRANGNYAFIDTPDESRKVLVEQMEGTLVTIAKDVKIQIEFNPAEVDSYRLIGYENRVLAAEDFENDKKDAGEIGAGHTVTALYELIPTKSSKLTKKSDRDDDESKSDEDTEAKVGEIKLRYQKKPRLNARAKSGELLTLKLRYKQPTEDTSTLIEVPVRDEGKTFSQADQDFQFAASVAAFGMLLRHSPHKGDANFDSVKELAAAGAQGDKTGYRTEFVQLVERASQLAK